MKIFSVDAETNDLYGEVFAIGVTVRENGVEVARFTGRAPDTIVTSEWVRKYVFPSITNMPVSHGSSDDLLNDFWEFWLAHNDSTVIAHCASPVETGLFRRCVEADIEGRQRKAPLVIHEVGTALLLAGENPDSVDDFNDKYADTSFAGTTHHPLYDAVAAAVCWEKIIGRFEV